MTLATAEELDALRQSVRALLVDRCDDAAMRAAVESESGYDEKLWELLTGQVGVLELGMVELCLVAEELGRALYPGPVLSTAVAAHVLDDASLRDGSKVAALVIVQPQAGAVPLPSVSVLDGALSGTVPLVVDAAAADVLVVEVGPERDIYVVDAKASGVSVEQLPVLDLTRRTGAVTLVGVAATKVGDGAVADRLRQAATIVLACEQVGAAEAAMTSAVAYSKVRTQFGRQIGTFQSIKHLCADMFVAVESGKAAARQAALDADSAELASIAKAWCSAAYVLCAETNVQIHGGIGFTWEHSAHVHLRRSKATEVLYGDAAHHRALLADLLGI